MVSTQVRKWTNGWEVPASSMPSFLLGVFWKGATQLMSRFSQLVFDFYINAVIGCVPSHLYVGKMCLCWAISIFYFEYFFSVLFFLVFENWCPYQGVHGPIPSWYIDFLTEFPVAVPSNVSCCSPSPAFFLCVFQTYQANPHHRTPAHAASITCGWIFLFCLPAPK